MPAYTIRQLEILEFVRESLEERGVAPTLEEIGSQLGGITRVSVLGHLRALETKGAIRRRAREARSIEILDPDYRPSKGIPLAGTIAAGRPILAAEDRDDVVLEDFLGVDENCYLLRVAGQSMIDDHIADGDLVLVEKRAAPRNGEMVVAVVDEEATLKRFYMEGRKIRLQPANPEMKALRFAADRVEVRGVVRGVIRRV
ncbi:MAG: transcriptional repressor LexA [Planctomycetota bacterium]|nr:transcriptional repressor LexA [Planctomycetota bacterium]